MTPDASSRLPARTRRWARTLANQLGYDIVRAQAGTAFSRQRLQLLNEHAVTLAVDVGASRGEYASDLRGSGFTGTILSIEPLGRSYEVLAQRAELDPGWRAFNLAAGPVTEVATFNVSGRDDCSSLLAMDERHRRAAPGSEYVSEVTVHLVRIDDLLTENGFESGTVFMKLDVQGYELDVLRGADATLNRVAVLESELSMVRLYREQPLIQEVVDALRSRGLILVGLEPAFNDPQTNEILQLNGLFSRTAG